jgi:hypothetical protein
MWKMFYCTFNNLSLLYGCIRVELLLNLLPLPQKAFALNGCNQFDAFWYRDFIINYSRWWNYPWLILILCNIKFRKITMFFASSGYLCKLDIHFHVHDLGCAVNIFVNLIKLLLSKFYWFLVNTLFVFPP